MRFTIATARRADVRGRQKGTLHDTVHSVVEYLGRTPSRPAVDRRRAARGCHRGYVAVNGGLQVLPSEFRDAATFAGPSPSTPSWSPARPPATRPASTAHIASNPGRWSTSAPAYACGAISGSACPVSLYRRNADASVSAPPAATHSSSAAYARLPGNMPVYHDERAVHLHALMTVPVNPAFTVTVFGGPTVFSLRQDLVTDVRFTHSYRTTMLRSQPSLPGSSRGQRSASTLGSMSPTTSRTSSASAGSPATARGPSTCHLVTGPLPFPPAASTRRAACACGSEGEHPAMWKTTRLLTTTLAVVLLFTASGAAPAPAMERRWARPAHRRRDRRRDDPEPATWVVVSRRLDRLLPDRMHEYLAQYPRRRACLWRRGLPPDAERRNGFALRADPREHRDLGPGPRCRRPTLLPALPRRRTLRPWTRPTWSCSRSLTPATGSSTARS